MPIRMALGVLGLLLMGACTASSGDPGSTTTLVPAASTSTTPSGVSIDSGRLVVLEADGSVAVIEPDGSGRVPIAEADEDVFFSQPIWSPDASHVSFGEASADGFAVNISPVEGEEAQRIAVSNNPFYMYWSGDGETIGVLHNGRLGLDFVLVDVSEGTASRVDGGTPFYFSWSPDSDRVAIHEGVSRFETIDLGGARSPLVETGGGYLVPQWLPQGILHVVDAGLVLSFEDESRVLVEVGEQTMFVANSQGTRVAVQTLGAREQTVSLAQTDRLQPNVVAVVDIETRELEVVEAEPVVGFWWSPDGESLLMFSPISSGSALMAKVWTAGDGLVEYSRFRPSPILARDLLPFFPQYAQSMTFWAPDSSGFAIAGEVGGEVGIWLQQLGVSEPKLVSDGLWVAWSPE